MVATIVGEILEVIAVIAPLRMILTAEVYPMDISLMMMTATMINEVIRERDPRRLLMQELIATNIVTERSTRNIIVVTKHINTNTVQMIKTRR